LEIIWRK